MGKRQKVRKAANKTLTRLLPWFLLAGGFIVLILLRGLIASLPAESADQPTVEIWLRVWLLLVVGAGIAVGLLVREGEVRSDVIALLIGIWLAGALLLVLKNTSYALNGVGGDAGFQTAQVTKFAAYSGSVDFAYKGLPAFYPPLYFFILGKTAALFQFEPYKAMKYGLIAIAFLLPFLTRRMWSLVISGEASLALGFSALLFQNFYKPAEWLSLFLFVPWWIYFVTGIGSNNRKRNWTWFLAGSLLGAAIFTTYYYWFFIGAVSLLTRYGFQRLATKTKLRADQWGNKLKILGGTALFSLPYWGPYLWSMWVTGGWSPLQNRYFIPEFANLELPFLEFSISGLLLLVGLVYLLLSFREKPLSLALMALLAGAYIWQFAGYAAFLLNAPLLTFKAREFVIYVLVVAALLAGGEFLVGIWTRKQDRARWAGVLVGMAIALPLYYGQIVGQELTRNDLLSPANEETYPQELISAYQAAIRSSDLDRVVLGDGDAAELSIYLPVYQFVSWAAHFSHPAGLYYERIAFIEELSRTQNPGWFAAAVMNNRYTHIDEIVLRPVDSGYAFYYRPDNFPYPVESESIFLRKEIFVGEFFGSKLAGELDLFSPNYENNPLSNLPVPQDVTASSSFGVIGDAHDMYIFLVDFGSFIQFENEDQYWEILSGLFSTN